MTLEFFVVQQVIPALDAAASASDNNGNMFQVEDENKKAVRFKLVEDLAGGASARIYKSYSRDKDALKPIAIKRIESEGFKDYEDEFEQLLARERRAMKELSETSRTYVPEFKGYFYYDLKKEHWLAMELCDGASLYQLAPLLFSRPNRKARARFPRFFNNDRNKERKKTRRRSKMLMGEPKSDPEVRMLGEGELQQRSINLKQVAAIAAGALRGLTAIHKAGFIHGDIKSGNILLCYPGIVKIVDFGLTSKLDGEEDPDLHALGTLDYMAPEQMLKSLALDHRKPNPERYTYNKKIDVWALGIIVLELLIGRTPLSDLRRIEDEEFSFFIANMCKPRLPQNKGSALGFFFYLPQYQEDILKANVDVRDLDELVRKNPVLKKNKAHLLWLLMRPYYYNKRPDPSAPVKRPKVPSLYMINKCLDFVAQCLYIRYHWRPTAEQMQKHEFVKSACMQLERIEPQYDTILKLQKQRSTRKTIWKKFQTSLTVHEIYEILKIYERRKRAAILRETL